jgi:adenylate cyclase
VAAGLVLLLGMVVPAAALRTARPRRRALVALMLLALLAGALYATALQLAFSADLIVPCVYPLVALALSGVAVLAVESTHALAERERVRELFIRYVPERVVDDVLKTADDDLCLAGEIRQGTVLVCDIRGFTAFSESRPAEDVIHVLNRFLGDMAQAILDHGGTLLGYRGDGIFAVFGAPLEQADHADRALAAAREMAGPRLERFNAWLEEHTLGRPFRIGVGLNSGRIVSGHVGCEVRVEYTAIGDPVNTAFRLEEMTKRLPHDVLISGTTQAMLRGPAPGLRYVDSTVIRGKEVEVGLWTLDPGAPAPPRRFEAGREAPPITRI